MGLGYEHVRDADFVGNAPQWAEEAVAKLSARPVQPGRYDLVLMPSHLFLTIHESIAHPTELDRIMGYEANYAGTSFISRIEDYLGKFRYGRELMNVQGERSRPGSLATVGWDDEGVRPGDYLIVKDGILHDLQTTREQAPWLADWYRRIGEPVRSHGNSLRAELVRRAVPADAEREPAPDPERDVSLEELIADVRDGILIEGRGVLLHRPAALQRAVRRAGVPRDPQRARGGDAQGRRLPDPHAGVLELDGPDRRAEQLRAWAAPSTTARASPRRATPSRTAAPGALPRGQRDQHRDARGTALPEGKSLHAACFRRRATGGAVDSEGVSPRLTFRVTPIVSAARRPGGPVFLHLPASGSPYPRCFRT
jgi:hypothetical protein